MADVPGSFLTGRSAYGRRKPPVKAIARRTGACRPRTASR